MHPNESFIFQEEMSDDNALLEYSEIVMKILAVRTTNLSFITTTLMRKDLV